MATLYFRQLLAGRDFATQHPYAHQMENFVYLIGDLDTKQCMVIDPAWAVNEIVQIAQQDGMSIVGALATHYHPDHVGGHIFGHSIEGLSDLIAIAPCKVHSHTREVDGICKMTGLSKTDLIPHESGDIVWVGQIPIELLHTPGHTPGSMCFKVKNSLISGDTLFLNGCGRVDLPGGNTEDMFDSLQNRIASLPNNTILFPGHAYGGDHAPLEQVKKTNPILQIHDLFTFINIHKRSL